MKQVAIQRNKNDTGIRLLTLLWPFFRYAPLRITFFSLAPLISGWLLLAAGLLEQSFFNQLDASTISRAGHRAVIFWAVMTILLANIAVQAASFILNYLRYMSAIKIRFSLSSLLQHNLLERILRYPTGLTHIDSLGTVINTFDEDTKLVIGFFSLLGDMLSLFLLGIVAFVILARDNLSITLLIVLPLACSSAIIEKMRVRISKTRTASREASSAVVGGIREIFDSIQSIKVARAEENIVEYFRRLSDRRRLLEVHDAVLSSSIQALFNGLGNLGIGLVLLITALFIQQGNAFRVGDLVLFTTYLSSCIAVVTSIGFTRARYLQAAVSLQRLAQLQEGVPLIQLLEKRPLYLDASEASAFSPILPLKKRQDYLNALEVHDLTYRYPGTERGIKQACLRLTRGSLTVITGPIGAGKSTLLRTLLGLLPKEAGEIRWNGQLVENPAAFFVPPRSAYTAQIPHLFSDTLKENILLGLPEEQVDLPQAVRISVLERDISEQEQGVDTPIGARGVKLSGGQVQRTATARMLVRDVELFVCDDLSSALDVETEKALWEYLLTNNRDRTYLVVSHRKALLQRADQIIVLQDGRVEIAGDPTTVLARLYL